MNQKLVNLQAELNSDRAFLKFAKLQKKLIFPGIVANILSVVGIVLSAMTIPELMGLFIPLTVAIFIANWVNIYNLYIDRPSFVTDGEKLTFKTNKIMCYEWSIATLEAKYNSELEKFMERSK